MKDLGLGEGRQTDRQLLVSDELIAAYCNFTDKTSKYYVASTLILRYFVSGT